MDWPIFRFLAASPEVTALVGTAPVRIYQTMAPDVGTAARPTKGDYITWNTAGGAPENYVSNRPGIDRGRFQIDCWSEDRNRCRQLAKAVRDALEGHGHMVALPQDDYEDETKLFRWMLDFELFVHR